jgi:hypothetical protein
MLSKLARFYGVSETELLAGGGGVLRQGHIVNGSGIAQGHIVNGGSARGDIVSVRAGGEDGDKVAGADGLAALAADDVLLSVLEITPDEWVALRTIALPGSTDKAGYVQLLATIRGITRR